MNKDKLIDNVLMVTSKIQGNRYVQSITNGLMASIPITIFGALGSLVNSVPIPAYQDFLVSSGLKAITSIPTEITNNLLALYMVMAIATNVCKSFDISDGILPGITAFLAFLILTPFTIGETGVMAAIPTQWLGAPGLFSAFIVAIISGKVYSWIKIKGWTIKMPDSVPPNVSESLSSLVPTMLVGIGALIIRGVFAITEYGDIHNLIFTSISKPLQHLGGGFLVMVFALILCQIMWLLGIHGALIIISVFTPIWMSSGVENLAAFNAGEAIPNMVTGGLFAQALAMGSGQTLGLAILMVRAKSKRYKVLGDLSIVPNICGINEPLIFATPIVLNPLLAIPFIVMPLITLVSAYLGCLTGLLPWLPGISAPLGTPIIFSGFVAGGMSIRWAIFQVIMLVLSYLVYKPFFNKIDRIAVAEEQGQTA